MKSCLSRRLALLVLLGLMVLATIRPALAQQPASAPLPPAQLATSPAAPTRQAGPSLSFDPATVCPYATPPTYSSNPANTQLAFENEVTRLVNLERAKYGLWPLKINYILRNTARAHSIDMVTRDFFDHINPDGKDSGDRALAAGYRTYGWGDVYVGENIAAVYSSPKSAMAGWMTSLGHCKNILEPLYREIGNGYYYDANDGGVEQWNHYWTMMLGSAPKVLPLFINRGAKTTTSRQVTLTFTDETVSSWGSIGPVTQVRVSERSDFVGAVWQSFPSAEPPTLPFTLSDGSGSKKVYVRYRDASNLVVSANATITLNLP